MRRPCKRNIRVAKELHRALAKTLLFDMSDERLRFVTITNVDVSGDLKHAKVYVSVEGGNFNPQQVTSFLTHASSIIVQGVKKRIKLRYIPHFSFIYDSSIENGFHIDNILRDISSE
ncbi:MAG: 30S ribosome-binding factor RbfA [Deltaproteobacteria bacterium]|nr:30S ribosome-binding factor RbfA [Deltaproteobacteria bacterium]